MKYYLCGEEEGREQNRRSSPGGTSAYPAEGAQNTTDEKKEWCKRHREREREPEGKGGNRTNPNPNPNPNPNTNPNPNPNPNPNRERRCTKAIFFE